MTLLAIEDLGVRLADGAVVLRGVSLAVEAGQSVGLVGESGSGKSLLALTILGLLPPGARASGSVRLDGQALLGAPERTLRRLRGSRIGMVFQEPRTALDPLQTLAAVVAEPLRAHGVSRAEARLRAVSLLEAVGLGKVSPDTWPHRLSGGQRQRVMIAAALAGSPDLLLADEPTTALDAPVRARILDLLGQAARERRMAMLLISHDLAVVGRRADRVVVLYAGMVVEEGETGRLFGRLAHPYTRGLAEAAPHLTGARIPQPMAGSMPDPRALPTGCPFAPRCPRASARCAALPPLLGDDTHRVACWHPW